MDLSKDFEKIPVRAQGDAFTCSAEATAGMLDYWRCKNTPELCRGPHGLAGNATSVAALVGTGYRQGGHSAFYVNSKTDVTVGELPGLPAATYLKAAQAKPPAGLCTIDRLEDSFKTLAGVTGDGRAIWGQQFTEESMMAALSLRIGNKQENKDCSIQGLFRDWYRTKCSPDPYLAKEYKTDEERFLYSNDDGRDNVLIMNRIETCFKEKDQEMAKQSITSLMQSVFPKCDKRFSDASDAWSKLWPEVIAALASQKCDGPALASQLPPFEVADEQLKPYDKSYPEKMPKIKGVLDDAIKAGRPAAIVVCMKTFYDPKVQEKSCVQDERQRVVAKMEEMEKSVPGFKQLSAEKKLMRAAQTVDGHPDTRHTVIVIGARMNGGKCQYKIRNSVGNDCAHYTKDQPKCGSCPAVHDKSVKCDPLQLIADGCCESEKAYQTGCCDGHGNQWVDADVVAPNLVGATSMKPNAP